MKNKDDIIEIPFGAKDSELYKFEYTIPDGHEARIEGNKVIIEQKESEDEKIRAALLRCCDDWEKGQFGCMAKEDVPAIRAYLEKQKEKKTFSQEVFDAAKHEALWGEQKPVDYDHEMWKNCEANFEGGKKEVIEHPEKYGLQKPAEWSEEDEKMLDAIIHDVMTLHNAKNLEELKNKVSWLKSLRPQPKQEWSQEDNEFADDAIACVTRCYKRYIDNKDFYQSLRHNTLDIKRWLLNVRKRLSPHWKPSEEQMKALRLAYEDAFECPEGCVPHMPLKSLLSDIQKLL